MKYFVILIASYNNETADKKAIYEYEKEVDALANFHSYVGTFMKDTTVKHFCIMAINSNGGVYETEVFDR